MLEIVANAQDYGLWIGKLKLDETCCKEPDVTFVKADDPKPMTLVSWKVKAGGIDQGIDILLVPSSPTNQLEKFAALKDVNGVKNLLYVI